MMGETLNFLSRRRKYSRCLAFETKWPVCRVRCTQDLKLGTLSTGSPLMMSEPTARFLLKSTTISLVLVLRARLLV